MINDCHNKYTKINNNKNSPTIQYNVDCMSCSHKVFQSNDVIECFSLNIMVIKNKGSVGWACVTWPFILLWGNLIQNLP